MQTIIDITLKNSSNIASLYKNNSVDISSKDVEEAVRALQSSDALQQQLDELAGKITPLPSDIELFNKLIKNLRDINDKITATLPIGSNPNNVQNINDYFGAINNRIGESKSTIKEISDADKRHLEFINKLTVENILGELEKKIKHYLDNPGNDTIITIRNDLQDNLDKNKLKTLIDTITAYKKEQRNRLEKMKAVGHYVKSSAENMFSATTRAMGSKPKGGKGSTRKHNLRRRHRTTSRH